MVINLSSYYYTNKLIPVATDSLILKIVKVVGVIFLGAVAFLLDCTFKLLTYRSIKKDKPDLVVSSIVKEKISPPEEGLNELSNPEELQNRSIPDIESRDQKCLLRAEEQEKPEIRSNTSPVVEEKISPPEEGLNALSKEEGLQNRPIPIETQDQKYVLSFEAQKKTLKTCLDKFQATPQSFLKNLKLFVAKEPIDFKFVVIFGKTPSAMHRCLIKIIEIVSKDPSGEGLPNDYKEYTYAIRDALNTEEYKNNKNPELAYIIQELCFAKFVNTILTGLEEGILKSVITFNPSQMTSKAISTWISKNNKVLRNRPKGFRKSFLLNVEKACNAAGVNSDQLSSANIPELRSIHAVKQDSKPYDVYYIRHPTPTIEEKTKAFWARFTRNNATTVAPEFIGFLDSIQRKGLPFLYVNHQYMDKEGKDLLLSADNNRAEAIQGLEKSYPECFYFLSLPFDGPIVKSIKIGTLQSWKENLVDAVIREKQGFKIPKKFRKSALGKKEQIAQLLNNLHKLYFSGKLELNEIERRVLLVIFYSYLKEFFKSEYQIHITASVCKDNKDRGNVSACIDEALFNLRLGKEDDGQAVNDLHLRILSPFIFRGEGIVEHRLQFLIDLLDHIAALSDAQKEKIRAFKVNERYQIVKQWVPREENTI